MKLSITESDLSNVEGTTLLKLLPIEDRGWDKNTRIMANKSFTTIKSS